ncbi:alpha-hydroxy-acid oxidizing protein [Alphaproteobacteria bacterium]|nr:alpha-hydroxy-acid oxidizing protein [Alphaproteobacteria bacterium]
MSGTLFTVDDARQRAMKRLPKMMFDFVDGASGNENLKDANVAALNAVRLMPRVLIDVGQRDLSTQIVGQEVGLPFGMAPMGMCNLTWPGADRFMAHEAARRRIPLCVSTASSSSLETIIEDAEGHAWFQLYVDQSQEFVDELISRAEAADYKVLILTVDVPIPSVRKRDLRNGFKFPIKWGPRQIWDFATHPHWSLATLASSVANGLPRPMNYATSKHGTKFVRSASRGGANWDFLERLRARWKGKLVVKGVQCPEDALRIKSMGADAIYVSNHGGRQLNAAPPAIDSLGQIRECLGDDMPLIFDSGVRNGEHVIKALASGANFAMVGRSVMYGIGAGGADGLSQILDAIAAEASSVMGLAGQLRAADIDSNNLAASHASKTESQTSS